MNNVDYLMNEWQLSRKQTIARMHELGIVVGDTGYRSCIKGILVGWGWRCTRRSGHDGPCALKPRWWNLIGRIQQCL